VQFFFSRKKSNAVKTFEMAPTNGYVNPQEADGIRARALQQLRRNANVHQLGNQLHRTRRKL
jgi:hypothetical protein